LSKALNTISSRHVRNDSKDPSQVSTHILGRKAVQKKQGFTDRSPALSGGVRGCGSRFAAIDQRPETDRGEIPGIDFEAVKTEEMEAMTTLESSGTNRVGPVTIHLGT
jgi:hypothetical protein